MPLAIEEITKIRKLYRKGLEHRRDQQLALDDNFTEWTFRIHQLLSDPVPCLQQMALAELTHLIGHCHHG